MPTYYRTTEITELAARLSRRSSNYPSTVAVAMRQAYRHLMASELDEARWNLNYACQYAEAYDVTEARRQFVIKAANQVAAEMTRQNEEQAAKHATDKPRRTGLPRPR